MTSASLVDGIFIGNYEGVNALAAVNLIIPIMTLLFGVGMMLAIGGSVRGGKYLGEGSTAAASAIFSKTLLFIAIYGIAVIMMGLALEEQIFAGLGATRELFPIMSEYYGVIMPFFFAQLLVVVLYFFIRLDGFPNLAAAALTIGAVLNIALDYLFIAVFGWGLPGAAFATGLSQVLPVLVMLIYFFRPERSLQFNLRQNNWREVFQAAYNGISEFINEVSGAIIAFICNWMLIQRAGVNGVAAITVVNYLLLLGFNMLISGYLTAIHLPFQSGVVAVCRSLVFPAGFLTLFYYLLSDHRFVAALPVAEGFTFVLALVLFMRHRPEKAV